MNHRIITTTLTALATLAWASPAAAEEVEQNPEAIAKLRECVTEYTKEKYAEALVLCKESLGIQRSGATLLTIAKTYEKLGKCELATTFAQESLEQGELGLNETGRKKAGDFMLKLPKSKACAPAETEPVYDEVRFGLLSYVGAGALVLGAGGVGGAAYFGSQAQSQLDELGNANSQEEYDRIEGDATSNQSLGQVLFYSGAGLAAVGAALIVVDAVTVDQIERPMAVVVPTFGPNQLGVSTLIRF